MFKEVQCRKFSVKSMVILSGLLLIAVCAFAQTPDWQWASQAGGSSNDNGYSITIDDAGNSYVTGQFSSTATFGAYTLTTSGNSDIFVAKMDVEGNWLWANQSGGTGYGNAGLGIAVDNYGNCFVTGYFQYTATFGASSLSSEGANDIFVAKLDADGNWQWAIQSSGTSYGNMGRGITVDGAGNIYVTGYFQETATFGAYSITSYGDIDIFVAKLDVDGYWQWASQAGSTSGEYSCGITIDTAGDIYVTGYIQGTAVFGSYSLTSYGGSDIFVAKIDSNGDWQWASQAGGYWGDISRAISTDAAGNSYVTGWFNTNATFGSYSLTSYGDVDIFVAKIDANGDWQWAAKAGNSGGGEDGCGISTDNAGSSYVTGYFQYTATFGSYSLISSGGSDIFVAKMDADGSWLWAVKAGGTSWNYGLAIATDDNGNSYVIGTFRDTATFGSYSLTSSGGVDIFVAKLNPPVSTDPEINPDAFSLSNYPNPFNTITMINYALKREAQVRLEVYNLKGQLVQTLLEGNIQVGDHTLEWDSHDMPSGVYFLKMKAGSEESIRKLILLR